MATPTTRQVIRKKPTEVVLANVDFGERLNSSTVVAIVSSGISPSGPSVTGEAISDNGRQVQLRIEGGTAGNYHTVTVTASVSDGRTLVETGTLKVEA